MGIPGIAHLIHGCTVVQNAPVGRPGPGPAGSIAQARIGIVPIGHLVAFLRPGAGKYPAVALRGAVIAQLREVVQQLALAQDLLAVVVEHVSQRIAIGLFGHFFGMREVWVVISIGVPGHAQNLLGTGTAFLFVQATQLHHDFAQNIGVMTGQPWRLLPGVVPLQPAARVHDGTVLFSKTVRWQAEHLRHHFFCLDVVELAFIAPEVRGLGDQRVHNNQELQLGQGLGRLVLVRHRGQRIKALRKVTVDLAFVHHVEVGQHVIAAIPLG